MYDDHVPPHLEGPLRAFEDAIADLRTRRIRLERAELPELPAATPAQMAEAAALPDAPREMRDVARAVAERRTTWEDVLAARTDSAPEVDALLDASRRHFEAAFAELEEQERAERAALHGRQDGGR